MFYKISIFLGIFWSLGSSAAIDDTQDISFSSKILKDNIRLKVALPESYHHTDSFRYPVIYVLDGNTHFMHVVGNTDFYSTYAIVPEFIVVAINSNNRLLDYTPTEIDDLKSRSGGAANYLKFFSEELIPYIEKHYRAADYKILTGHSMSGLFVTYAMLNNNVLFDAHIAISPSLWWDGEWIVNHSETRFASHPEMASYLFLSLASEPNEMRQAYDRQVDVLKERAPKALRWNTSLLPDETHDSTPLKGYLQAIRDLFQGWNAVPEIEVKPLKTLREHYRKISSRYGYEFPLSAHQYNVYGLKAAYEGKPEWGIEILREGIKVFPRSDVLWDGLAEAYEMQGNLPEATKCAETALKLAKENKSQWQEAIALHVKNLKSRK